MNGSPNAVLSIDPSQEESVWCILDGIWGEPVGQGINKNDDIYRLIRTGAIGEARLFPLEFGWVVVRIPSVSKGQPASNSLVEKSVEAGRFLQCAKEVQSPAKRVFFKKSIPIRQAIVGRKKCKESELRAALAERFGEQPWFTADYLMAYAAAVAIVDEYRLGGR